MTLLVIWIIMGLIVFGIELEEEGDEASLFMCLALWPVGLGLWIRRWLGKGR